MRRLCARVRLASRTHCHAPPPSSPPPSEAPPGCPARAFQARRTRTRSASMACSAGREGRSQRPSRPLMAVPALPGYFAEAQGLPMPWSMFGCGRPWGGRPAGEDCLPTVREKRPTRCLPGHSRLALCCMRRGVRCVLAKCSTSVRQLHVDPATHVQLACKCLLYATYTSIEEWQVVQPLLPPPASALASQPWSAAGTAPAPFITASPHPRRRRSTAPAGG